MDRSAPNRPDPKSNTTSATSASRTTPSIQLDPKIRYELTRLDKSIPFTPIKRYLHHTWAQTFFSRPELFFQPRSVPELQKIVTLARRCRKRLCVTGYGHSPSDLTCTSSWLINLDNLNRLIEVDIDGKPGHVRFEAGISLHDLNQNLAKHGYTLPNLGSIDVQSLAGAISTGTHGSSLKHGILSQSVTSLTVLLSNSQLVACSATKNPDLFRAALCSLGAMGIIVEMTFQAVPDFKIAWSQSLNTLQSVLDGWEGDLWTTHEYTRVWWLPYLKRAVIWRANRTEEELRAPKVGFYGGKFGYYVYHNLLAVSNYIPRILPWIEWFVFGMQYGFKPGVVSMSAVEPARSGLLMDCLYSQFVNEWALPLHKGPEAISRLSAWINGDDGLAVKSSSSSSASSSKYTPIPVSNRGIYVHCPIEVRVTNTNTATNNKSGVKPFLDPTPSTGATLYLNATLYRPYGKDPPCHEKYYEAFEWLMRDMGAKPHWAKNFAYTDKSYISQVYGDSMTGFMKVRDESDPDGMFLGEWHVRNLPVDKALLSPSVGAASLVSSAGPEVGSTGTKRNNKSMVEGEIRRKPMGFGFGDGKLWEGARVFDGGDGEDFSSVYTDEEESGDGDGEGGKEMGEKLRLGSRSSTTSTGTSTYDMLNSRASEESFDLMAKGEASVYGVPPAL